MGTANRFNFFNFWKPSERLIDQILRKISRDDYLTIVSVFGSLCGLVQGFITTLSGIMLMDVSFLEEMGRYDATFPNRLVRFRVKVRVRVRVMDVSFLEEMGRYDASFPNRLVYKILGLKLRLGLGWGDMMLLFLIGWLGLGLDLRLGLGLGLGLGLCQGLC
jgi:hypothetical protein